MKFYMYETKNLLLVFQNEVDTCQLDVQSTK